MSGRIESLSAYALRVPLQRPLLLSNQTIAVRDYVVVEVRDGDGALGRAIGYSRGAPVEAVVARMLAPAWGGAALDDYPALYDTTVRTHSMQGSHGIFWRALSLADCAVHDLAAIRAGVPLARYLGGDVAAVPATLAGCYPVADETPGSIGALMARMASFAPRGVKITGSGDLARDSERLRLCRATLPESVPLIIDLYNSAPPPADLLPYAQRWAEFGMEWLEDPYGFDEFGMLAELAAGLPYSVGVGDEQAGLAHFRNLIDVGRIGVVRLDATTCGGVTGFRRIAALAAARGLPVSAHVFHHLHAQLAAATPGVLVEYMLPDSGADAIDLVLDADLDWTAAGIVPAAGLGVGYAWNEATLRKYRRGPD